VRGGNLFGTGGRPRRLPSKILAPSQVQGHGEREKKVLKKVLIANRGEIACRIIRTAKRMGIRTVAVYSDADAKALHVAQADEAVHIGPSPAPESYLRIDKIIGAAKATGADAIHPGYGFLSESAEFVEAVVAAGITFIGPSASAMRALGGKAAAKEIAIKAGVPVVPGYQGAGQEPKALAAEAKRIGYPVMIKATAGGGGRGMRMVEKAADFADALDSAKREATSAFGNDIMLIEKLVVAPRHIEVQVFGDTHGGCVHLFERDCSLQRRNQKVIEEAPAPGMSPELRAKLCEAAVRLAKSVGYAGAGTVEFLVEGGTLHADAPWYFIEMNTRLQVEHPVTEEITGLDLVEWQFRVAAGEKLPKAQADITMSGHAIEVRICAEDPSNGFMPSVGRILRFDWVSGMRLERGVEAGSEVSPYYDSMIAKLITHSTDRASAINRQLVAFNKLEILGPQTNMAFLRALLTHTGVQAGKLDTGLIGREIETLTTSNTDCAIATGALALLQEEWPHRALLNDGGHWHAVDAFQLNPPRHITVPVLVEGEKMSVLVEWSKGEATAKFRTSSATYDKLVHVSNGSAYVLHNHRQTIVSRPVYDIHAHGTGDSTDAISAPINGRLARIFVEAGQQVAKGDKIAVVEAMKMEHMLVALRDGTIDKIAATEGAQVTQGTLIATLVQEVNAV
jgi:3-methylcrotonyl-CoA carboxylase alpha subunit